MAQASNEESYGSLKTPPAWFIGGWWECPTTWRACANSAWAITASNTVLKSIASSEHASTNQKAERLKQLFKDYNSVGITSSGDRNANPEAQTLYQQLRAEGGLTVRVALTPEQGELQHERHQHPRLPA